MAAGFPDDLRVVVLNKNEFSITKRYDGKEYAYLPKKPLTVPPEVAWFHFAFDTRLNPAQRSRTNGVDHRGVSWYQNILTSMGWAEDDFEPPLVKKRKEPWYDAATKQSWFDNFDFRVIGAGTIKSERDFAALPS